MMRFIFAALAALVTTTGAATAQTFCSTFDQADCLRFDIPSVLDNGNLPRYGNAPGGPQVVQALQAGTVQGAGTRSIVVYVWGAGNAPATALRAYSHATPRGTTQPANLVEISPNNGPRFEPRTGPSGPARAFRITYSGPMVSFQLPRAVVGDDVYMVICPEGEATYPDRVTVRSDGSRVQNGLWFLPQEMKGWATNPRITRVTTRPLTYRR